MADRYLLVDGYSIINRAFYGVPLLTNAEGLHTNGIYGFLNMLFKALEDEKATHVAVAFDVHHPTFRHERYEAYKGTRKKMPAELLEQIPVLKDVLTAMEIPTLELAGFEADDILGTLAKKLAAAGHEVTILSGDRDLLQIADEAICIRLPKTSRGLTTDHRYHAIDVEEQYNLKPYQIIELKALMGDSSDNIPGLPGVGEKTATKLLLEYGTVANAWAHIGEIKPERIQRIFRENHEAAFLSHELATIKTDVPIDWEPEQAKIENLFTKDAYDFFVELGFKQFLSKFDDSRQTNVDVQTVWIEDRRTAAECMTGLSDKKIKQLGIYPVTIREDYVGMAVSDGEQVWLLDQEVAALTEVQHWLEELRQAGCILICHDLKRDLYFMQTDTHISMADVQLAAYLLNPLQSEYLYEDLAKLYGDTVLPGEKEICGREKREALYQKKDRRFLQIACYPAYTAALCYQPLCRRLKAEGLFSLYQEMEMPLIPVLFRMEREGISVSTELLQAQSADLAKQIESLQSEIYALAGETFNINSPKQLAVILFEKLALPGGKKTKTGYSTAADILEKLQNEYPIVKKILDYRTVSKLRSTYADGLQAYIGADGRIHSDFRQTITATGRISSTNPNLQNIPVRMEQGRQIRKAFVARPGYLFLDADYSQIELRVLAHMSGDSRLIEAYKEAEDIHAITASKVFNVPFDKVTPLMRRNAKAVNFGIIYGISAFGLSQDLDISQKEAASYIKQYFQTYPQIKDFLDSLVRGGKENGYVKTIFGRRRPMPELSSSNFMQRSFGERVAMNAPIQGSAADIIKIAMIRVDERLRREGLQSKLILQVHDELLLEVKREELETVRSLLQDEMNHAAALAVPLAVDMHDGADWYSVK
ncbi:MAG: DNA polymerase I [Lachnospiraceae bacterium]|nr:DNA polymerase I [Lachnospiraceae bacterium]MDY5741576.1 DNA polymerase I [Lachnospiraceae bacterium]